MFAGAFAVFLFDIWLFLLKWGPGPPGGAASRLKGASMGSGAGPDPKPDIYPISCGAAGIDDSVENGFIHRGKSTRKTLISRFRVPLEFTFFN
ncbi:MAG: hypothetical protein FWB91_04955 [Defluviitaleaceae bacterium]|nr:hypothetical protein [Defluviitaleaceae bacterium]